MKNQQKWLTKKLKGDWKDKDLILETTIFQSLIHFVEKEKGLRFLDYEWKDELEMGHVTKEYIDRIKVTEELIMHCYNYITVERPEIVKKIDEIDHWREFEEAENLLYKEDSEIMRIIIENRGYLWT